MKLKRSIYNIGFNFFSQFITLSLGIVIPRLFLVNYGSEINGLISSIGQVFVYIGLLEAGIGLTTTQALYKPISENDKNSINGILSATNIYYKKVGKLYIIAVILFSLLYPFLIKTKIDRVTVISVILLTGMGGAINFFLQNKYTVLLSADGRNYIMTNINMILSVLISLSKVILLTYGYNIIVIQLSQFLITLLRIYILNIYIKRNYAWINLSEKPNLNSISQRNSVFIHQISYLIFSNTDILILTLFCDLKVVSVYIIYNMLIGVVEGIISSVNNGIVFALGQIYNEDKDKFIKVFDIYEIFYMILVFSAFCVTQIFTVPFLKIYTTGINDINYIDNLLLILFIFVKLLTAMRSQCFTCINIAGHFKSTQKSSIIEAIINLFCTVVFVKFIGIYGVLLGTIFGLIYRSIYCIIYANKNILDRSPWITFKRWIINLSIFTIIILLNKFNLKLNSYMSIIKYSAIYFIVISSIIFIINMIFERKILRYIIAYINLKTKKVILKMSIDK